MSYFEVIVCMLLILLISGVGEIIYLFYKTKNYFEEIETEKKEYKPEVPFTDRIEGSLTFLSMIDGVISTEISAKIQLYESLNRKYEFTKLDNDIKEIATNVYNSLKPEMFSNIDTIIFNTDYLMNYIAKETRILFVKITQEYNTRFS